MDQVFPSCWRLAPKQMHVFVIIILQPFVTMNPWRFLAPLACVCLFVLVTCATGVEKVVDIRPAPRAQHDGTGPTPSQTVRDTLEREVAERNAQLTAQRSAKAKEAWDREEIKGKCTVQLIFIMES